VRTIGILAVIVVGLIVLSALIVGLASIPDFRRYKRIRSM
jgi:hypothetical protein